MATTTNYGWTTPDDTALVKDGAAAIRTLGSSVDTTTKNLNPETTLGDIAYRSSTANVKTRLGIGSTGQVLTVASGVPSWATPAVSTPTYVGASVVFTTTLSIANSTTTTLSFTAEVLDSNGFHDNSTNNSRLTIPSGYAGKYRISAQLFPAENSTGRREIRFIKNGSVLYGWNMNTMGTMERIDYYSFVDASVADYFEVSFRQSSGGALNLYGTTDVGNAGFFNIQYLGA